MLLAGGSGQQAARGPGREGDARRDVAQGAVQPLAGQMLVEDSQPPLCPLRSEQPEPLAQLLGHPVPRPQPGPAGVQPGNELVDVGVEAEREPLLGAAQRVTAAGRHLGQEPLHVGSEEPAVPAPRLQTGQPPFVRPPLEGGDGDPHPVRRRGDAHVPRGNALHSSSLGTFWTIFHQKIIQIACRAEGQVIRVAGMHSGLPVAAAAVSVLLGQPLASAGALLDQLAALRTRPETPERLGAESRMLYFLAETTPDGAERERRHQEGLAVAERALAIDPDAPSGLLWWSAHRGSQASVLNPFAAVRIAQEVEVALLRLRAAHPDYDHAAADRALGHLYQVAPRACRSAPWRKPASTCALRWSATPPSPPMPSPTPSS